MARARVLVIDADQAERTRLRAALSARDFEPAVADSLGAALALAGAFQPEAVLAGLAPAGLGAIVEALRSAGSDAAAVVMAPPEEVEAVVEALRRGAAGFVFAPGSGDQVAVALGKALETRRLRREAEQLRDQVRHRQVVVGSTPPIQVVKEIIRRAAPTKATVLVQGETGTGRGLVAQALHESSPRRDWPFVRVSCAGLSELFIGGELFGHEPGAYPDAPGGEGRIAAADGGTLYLHEVAGLPASVQVKLLRLLQHGEYERLGSAETRRADVRVVASTTHDLAEAVRLGRFRDDLYYRLGVVTASLPRLRERKGDIPALVEHLLERSAAEHGKPEVQGVSPGALSALYAHDWPGNVRELADAVDAAVARCDGREIGVRDLSPVLQGAGEDRAGSALIPGATLSEIEREAILRTLEEVGGSTARAAQILGISVRKIQYKLKEYRDGQASRKGGTAVLGLARAGGAGR